MVDWTVENYQDQHGRIPVDDYLNGLQPKDYARLLRAVELLVDYGPRHPSVRQRLPGGD